MKKILVTGAAGGMGMAITKKLTKRGYFVFAMDCRDFDAPENTEKIICDVRSSESVREAFSKVKSHCDTLAAIVHTAGIYDLDSLVEMSEERFLRIFDINLFGLYRLNKEFLPLLKKGSKIVITSSELAPLDPLPFTGIYAITKAAVEKYAYSLRMEMNLLGIKVSVIRPGATKTPLLGDSTGALDKFVANTKIYKTNSKRFKKIVDGVEAKNVEPDVIGQVACRIIRSKMPRYVYNINRNPLLLILNALPQRLQNFIIKMILTK